MFTLSIILNLHREGEMAAKTIQNLRDILNTPHEWKDIEVVAVLDNADEKTKEMIDCNHDLFQKIEEVNYKDLGESRNHGIASAENEFVVFADGDDYCSYTMLQALYEEFYLHYKDKSDWGSFPENEHIAVFPRYLIEFPALFQMQYCNSNDIIVQNNRFLHCYHSKISTHKSILKKYKIRRNTPPYGYEDWDLNNRLLSSGVQYKTATYKLYYRRENTQQSLLTKQVNEKYIVRNSPIYSFKYLKIKPILSDSNCTKLDLLNFSPRSTLMQETYRYVLFEEDREFLESYQEETTYRQDILNASTLKFSQELSAESLIYNTLMEFMHNIDIVYFIPWINLGGADKVILEYTKSIATKYNAALITTLNSGSRINSLTIPHLDLPSISEHWEHISHENKLHILIKAIINSNIKIVHIINSDIALQTIKYYADVYKEYNIKTAVSLFCPDYDWVNNEYNGYPVMYPELFSKTDIILSDNNYWYGFFKRLNNDQGFNFKKLSSTTQEMEVSYQDKEEFSKKILWASRICNQKLFGVFEEIVNQLPEYQFIIYGGEPEDQNNKEIFQRLIAKPNIKFRGEYQHISELDLNEFDLYLFTSLFEGIPTIILDMAMSGIPIVSANVGGISEVLGQDYSLLVKNTRDPQAYIDKINEFYQNKTSKASKMKEIRQYIIDTHNEKTFQNEYQTIIKGLLDGHR